MSSDRHLPLALALAAPAGILAGGISAWRLHYYGVDLGAQAAVIVALIAIGAWISVARFVQRRLPGSPSKDAA